MPCISWKCDTLTLGPLLDNKMALATVGLKSFLKQRKPADDPRHKHTVCVDADSSFNPWQISVAPPTFGKLNTKVFPLHATQTPKFKISHNWYYQQDGSANLWGGSDTDISKFRILKWCMVRDAETKESRCCWNNMSAVWTLFTFQFNGIR